jgi:hypothetical protein
MEAMCGKIGGQPEKSDAIAEHQEAPKEEAAVKSFGALKKRHGDKHLATG